jgi:hypothetical protein
MVYGHRFELFKMRATFLPLLVLGRFTLGLTDVLYTNPYLEAVTCQYYFALRKMAKILVGENAVIDSPAKQLGKNCQMILAPNAKLKKKGADNPEQKAKKADAAQEDKQ